MGAHIAGTGLVPADSKNIFFGLGALACVSGCQPPIIRSLVSKQASPSELGQIFGAIAAVEGVGQLLWPLVLEQMYKRANAQGHPQVVYFVGAAVSVVSLLAATATLWRAPPTTLPLSAVVNEAVVESKDDSGDGERDPLLKSQD